MKKVVIIAPHFPPCNLTASHRSRYFAQHLYKFGWECTILSVNEKYYEENTENELLYLLPTKLNVIRTSALPKKPLKVIGDLGLRSLVWHYRKLCSIVKENKVDLIYIPIPPNFSPLLGYLINRRFGIPYAIDYIDPWVHEWPEAKRIFSKAWFSYNLGKILEPIVLQNVNLVTSVAPLYYEDVRKNNKFKKNVEFLAIPYGIDKDEYSYLDENPRQSFLFSKKDKTYNFIYAGAMLPKAYKPLEALLNALNIIKNKNPDISNKINIHFVGTGFNLNNPKGYNIMDYVHKYDLADMVYEYPERISYMDVLNHLQKSQAVIILGSTERHYTPSKVFQAILSKRPLLAILHERSTAVEYIKNFNAKYLITFSDNFDLNHVSKIIADSIVDSISVEYDISEINWEYIESYSTETMVNKLAIAFDNIC